MRPSWKMMLIGCGVLMLSGCPFGHGLTFSVEVIGLDLVEPKGDALNDRDIVAGAAFPPVGQISPAVWRNGQVVFVEKMFDIGILHGINNLNVVVGVQLRSVGSRFHFVSFVETTAPPPRMIASGELYSVSEVNEFVGFSDQRAALGFVANDNVLLFEGEDSMLDATGAYDINDSRDFVGWMYSAAEGRRLAVKWLDGGARTLLDSLGGTFSEAYAINSDGVTVGVSTFPPAAKTTEPHHAVFWLDTEIRRFPELGEAESTAWDINDSGEAVGYLEDENGGLRAVLWGAPGVFGRIAVTDLNDVVDFGDAAPGSIVLREAIDINEVGTILCRAERTIGNAVERVYVLLRR